jgi:hypothetical protein
LGIVIKDNYIKVIGHRLSPLWKVSERNQPPDERHNGEGTRTRRQHIKDLLFIQYFVKDLFNKNRQNSNLTCGTRVRGQVIGDHKLPTLFKKRKIGHVCIFLDGKVAHRGD